VTTEPLSGREREAWRAVLVLADTLRALVSGAVAPATGLSSADYLVLNRLSDAPENRLSGLKALAAKLNWSRADSRTSSSGWAPAAWWSGCTRKSPARSP
jgi:hypothetical protein